ncbi:protein PSK SIMULATOR 1 isoform X2 [Gossypium hirsutum]|uniref:Protein PSK SIMULATOR 1 isoform X2 n=1 Tax=Gossypium hirsutum TaxID=3635 RepID=A0ABM3B7H0_GOSHI|nr:protein PSK SIMULATOR 1-like isoform X2 [Gossypium hirsutum]
MLVARSPERWKPIQSGNSKGDNLAILRAELKSQNKHVKNLKKKSLWSRILEEVMEKLVDIVHFLHLEIHEVFGAAGISGAPQDNNIMLWNGVIFGQQGE